MKTSDIFLDIEALKPEQVYKLPWTEFEMLRPDCKATLHKMYPDVYARLQKEHETKRTTRLDSKMGESTTDASKVPLHATHEPTHGSEYDVVCRPQHYASTSIECIDAMRETQGDEAVKHFCVCNAFKYLWRHNSKNGDEDIKKASWYLDKAVSLMEGETK